MSGEKKSRFFYEKERLCVWSKSDDSKLTFYGQDFGGTATSSEYEYWVTVDREDLRKALGANVDEDLGDLVCQRVDEIMAHGEQRWLTGHGINYQFSDRYEFPD